MAPLLSKKQVIKKLESIEDLPSLPVVMAKLNTIIQNVDSSASDVAVVMEEDPAIMTRVIKLVNSSFYSSISGEPITNVKHAVVRLGYDTIRDIALTTSVFSTFKGNHAKVFERKQFWKYCICTGLIANSVYEISDVTPGMISGDHVFLAGLLHDIGKIILEQFFHDEFSKILEVSHDNDTPLIYVEREMIGMCHSEIGAWLGKKWNLNADLLACIEFYPNPQEAPEVYRPLVNLIHLSDYIANFKPLGQSGNPSPPPYHKSAWVELGLEVNQINEILQKAEEAAERSQILLSLG